MIVLIYTVPNMEKTLSFHENQPIGVILSGYLSKYGMDIRRYNFTFKGKKLEEYGLSKPISILDSSLLMINTTYKIYHQYTPSLLSEYFEALFKIINIKSFTKDDDDYLEELRLVSESSLIKLK
jgi:hypothetical protein